MPPERDTTTAASEREWLEGLLPDGEMDDGDGYEWCWLACPHDPPCADAPPSSDPRDE